MFIEAGIRDEGVPQRDIWIPDELGKNSPPWLADEGQHRKAPPSGLDELGRGVQMVSQPRRPVLRKLECIDGERRGRPRVPVNHQLRARPDHLNVVALPLMTDEGQIPAGML